MGGKRKRNQKSKAVDEEYKAKGEAYEAARREKIAKQQEMLAELGLVEMGSQMRSEIKKSDTKRREEKEKEIASQPRRRSSRVKAVNIKYEPGDDAIEKQSFKKRKDENGEILEEVYKLEEKRGEVREIV